jgi:hypothetical protein
MYPIGTNVLVSVVPIGAFVPIALIRGGPLSPALA